MPVIEKNEEYIDPIIRIDGKYYLIGFNLTKPLELTQNHKAKFSALTGKYELSFEKASILASPEDECCFKSGDKLYVIAVKDKGVFYALSACAKELFLYFEQVCDSLEDIAEAQAILFKMPEERRNNIFLQMGIIEWSEDLEISNLLLRQEYKLKAQLCKDKIPHNILELMNYNFNSMYELGKEANVKNFDLMTLANIAYSNDEVKTLPIKETMGYLEKHTYLKPKDIERLAIALNQKRGRELRLFFEGFDYAGMDELAEAIGKLKRMPVCRRPLDGLACAFELVGETKTFQNSDVSLPVQMWHEAKLNRTVLYYEYLTSLGESVEHGSAKATSKLILGEKAVFDAYFKTNFPMSKSLIIASGEDFTKLHPGAQRLFDLVIHFEMSDEDKCEVIKDHLLTDLTKEKHIVVADDALRLTAQYSDDFGLRRTLDHLRYLIAEANENAVIDESFANEKLSAIANDCSPYIKYKLHRGDYYDTVAKAIEETQKKLLSRDAEKKPDYRYLCERLNALVQLRTVENSFDYKKGTIINRISKKMFGVENIAGELDDYFTTCSFLNAKDRMNIMLVGNPGSGKSTFAFEAAKVVAEEVCVIDLSIATADTILGVSRSRASKIVETWMKNSNFAIVFEEVDKADPEVLYLLLKMLDNSQVLQEKYLQVDLPLKNIHIFATSNSLNIPLPVLDRFRVFSFETSDRIKEGAFDKVIEKMEKAASEDCKLHIDVDPFAKSLILDKYSTSSSVREIEGLLGRVKEHLVANAEKLPGKDLRIMIDAQAVSEAIAETPYKRGNADTVPEDVPGCVIGTAVTGNGAGMTFAIEAMVFDSKNPTLEITGLAQDDINEQVKLAVTSINANYNGVLEGKTIHVHFSEGSVKKSGCSAGASTYVAILSAALGIPVSRGIAITGEIGLHGGVNAVGGVELKTAAAARDGCRLMVMPKENLERISDLDRAYLEEKIELLGITNIDELVELAMPEVANKKLRKMS